MGNSVIDRNNPTWKAGYAAGWCDALRLIRAAADGWLYRFKTEPEHTDHDADDGCVLGSE